MLKLMESTELERIVGNDNYDAAISSLLAIAEGHMPIKDDRVKRIKVMNKTEEIEASAKEKNIIPPSFSIHDNSYFCIRNLEGCKRLFINDLYVKKANTVYSEPMEYEDLQKLNRTTAAHKKADTPVYIPANNIEPQQLCTLGDYTIDGFKDMVTKKLAPIYEIHKSSGIIKSLEGMDMKALGAFVEDMKAFCEKFQGKKR